MVTTVARTIWIDYLRSFITLLVVAHHASLAYTTFAYFDTARYINSTAPVVDPQRWVGMDIFENYNDIFFMSLMFLISGLFVYNGIHKKGARKFLYDRLKRLGIPFMIAVTFVIPFAYLPSYYLAHHSMNMADFIRDYVVHQQWPVGPPWFIGMLLVFNIVAVMIPASFYRAVPVAMTKLARRPFRFFLLALVVVGMAYIPLSLWVGAYTWTGWGPFDFQLNRLLLYFIFFLTGVCLGCTDWEKTWFTDSKLLTKSWLFWICMSLACYFIVEIISFFGPGIVKAGEISSTTAWVVFDIVFVATCITTSFAFLAFFKQKIHVPAKTCDHLSANAYGIYLVHYVFVTWLQFALLGSSFPVPVKFGIVFIASLAMSWLLVAWIRRFTIVRQWL